MRIDLPYVGFENREDLIDGVILHKLEINRDARGILVEALRSDWKKVFDPKKLPFAMQYYSVTPSGAARDEDRWHVHTAQEDRFEVILGDVVLALYDWRKKSPTFGKINLAKMGESLGDDGQSMLLVPKQVLHCYLVTSDNPAVLINFPTKLYNPDDEGRIPFSQVGAKINNQPFSWDIIRSAK